MSGCSLSRYAVNNRYINIVAVLLCLFLITSCAEKPIAQDVSDNQARAIVAALSKEGLKATFQKKRQGSTGNDVLVKEGDFGKAVRLLHDKGLPESPRSEFLEKVTANTFLPDSREVEALRLDYALAMQLEELIRELPGIQSVRAVVRYHLTNANIEGQTRDQERAASIVIKSDKAVKIDAEDVRSIISSFIPGLKDNNLHISFHHNVNNSNVQKSKEQENELSYESFLFGWRVAREDITGLTLSFLALLALCGAASALAGYWFGFVFTSSKEAAGEELLELRALPSQSINKKSAELPEISL